MRIQSFLKAATAISILAMNAACLQEQVGSCTITETDDTGTFKFCAQFSGIGNEDTLRSECSMDGGTYSTTTCDTGGAVGSCTNIPSGSTGYDLNATVDQFVFQQITVAEELLAADPDFAKTIAQMVCADMGGTYQEGM